MSRILNSAHKSISPLLLGVPVRPTILFTFGLTLRRLLNRLADADLNDDNSSIKIEWKATLVDKPVHIFSVDKINTCTFS